MRHGRYAAAVPFSRTEQFATRGTDEGRLDLSDWAFFALLVTLPLQWKDLVQVGGNTLKPFQGCAVIFLSSWMVNPARSTARVPLPGAYRAFTLLAAVLVCYVGATWLVNESRLASPFQTTRDLVSIAASIASFQYLTRSLLRRRKAMHLLATAGVTASLLFVTVLFVDVARVSGSPVALLRSSIASGDSSQLMRTIFRDTFRADGSNLTSSPRHSMVTSVVVVTAISLVMLALLRHREIPHKRTHLLRTATVVLMLLISAIAQSRSVWLAIGVTLVVTGGWSWFVRRISRLYIALIVVAGTFASGLAGILIDRAAQTDSYRNRLAATGIPLTGPDRNIFFGAMRPSELRPPHNFVLEATLLGGLFAGTLALVGLISLVAAARQGASAAVHASKFLLLPWGVAVARLVTAGSGGLHMGEWVGLGFYFAVLASFEPRSRERTEREAEQTSADFAVRSSSRT